MTQMTNPLTLIHEPVLTQLPLALDPDHMLAVLSAATGVATWTACTIEHVRYQPRESCRVVYRLAHRAGSGSTDDVLSARLYPCGTSQRHFDKLQGRSAGEASMARPLHVAHLGLVASPFPADRKLDHLARFLDARWLREEVLPGIVRRHDGDDARITSLQTRLMHFVPERACTQRVDLEIASAHGPRQRTLYGKHSAVLPATTRCDAALQRAPMIASGRLRLPRLMDADAERGLSWVDAVPGAPLVTLSADRGSDLALFEAVGRAAAHLHAIALPEAPVAATPSATLEAARTVIGLAMPTLRARVDRLASRLLRSRPETAVSTCTLHGDLHRGNVLVDGDQVGFIDLDALCRGPAGHDLATLAAALIDATLRAGGNPLEERPRISALLEGHAAVARTPVTAEAFDWHLTQSLVSQRLYRTVRRLKPAHLAQFGALLDLAEDVATHGFLARTREGLPA